MSGISAIFDAVSFTPPKKSTFDGSHDIKTSCKIGDVFPLDVVPVYPSDNFQMNYTSQAKFSPLVAPAFARMNLKQWSFFVRNADLWDDFQEFVSGVNPKAGKTAYNESYSSDLVHPYIKNDKSLLGDMHIGVRLNLSGVDLSKMSIDSSGQLNVDREYFKELCGSLYSANSVFSYVFSDGDWINQLYTYDFHSCLAEVAGGDQLDSLEIYSSRNGSTSNDITFRACRYTGAQEIDDMEGMDNTYFMKLRGHKAKCVPGSVLDYLGFPCFDYAAQFASGDLIKRIVDDSWYSAMSIFLSAWQCDSDLEGSDVLRFRQAMHQIWKGDEIDPSWHSYGPVNCPQPYESYISDRISGFSDSFSYLDSSSGSVEGDNKYTISFRGILLRYLEWCLRNNVTSTLVGDAPCFCGLRLSSALSDDSVNMDSLRFRAYWKIWNDYYRHPNLTYEVPIPYSLGGDDLENFRSSVNVLCDDGISKGQFYDWFGRDWFDNKFYQSFGNFSTYGLKSFLSGDFNFSNFFRRLVKSNFVDAVFETLFVPFKHLRERDYLTGCLPNTSVVDVVAPIMPSSALDAYGEKPWTNDPMSSDGKSHDNTAIDPVRATEDAYTANVGWLDIENLRITQKLKEYFVSLRHTLGSFKDYVKVFFGADISDLTLHRAEFLGGSSQMVNISELVSSVSDGESPQGALAGRANSFGQSGMIDKFVNDYGFIITLECLSPLEINVGGLSRQLIRDTRFDYFNPKFAELGDMAVTKKEVCAAVPLVGYKGAFDEIFGYTPRYMDLKFIPSHVHGDFLGSMSDWHLDLLHSAINTNSVELSQTWLEEVEDDRIFSQTYEDANNCFIWCECRCVYQRALPAVSYEVIA